MRVGRALIGPLLALGLVIPPAGAETIDDLYYAGTEAYRSGDLKTALERFDAVRRRIGPEHVHFAPIHYNLGRCVELMVERGLPDPPVCEGAAWFETFLTHADERRSESALTRARAGRAILVERCAARNTPPPPTAPTVVEKVVAPPPTDPTRWWLAGGAAAAAIVGGVALFLAAEADGDADAAHARYRDAETEAEADRWAGLVRDAESEAMVRSMIGLAGLAGAAGLGIAAIVWDDPTPTALWISPSAVWAVWRF